MMTIRADHPIFYSHSDHHGQRLTYDYIYHDDQIARQVFSFIDWFLCFECISCHRQRNCNHFDWMVVWFFRSGMATFFSVEPSLWNWWMKHLHLEPFMWNSKWNNEWTRLQSNNSFDCFIQETIIVAREKREREWLPFPRLPWAKEWVNNSFGWR